jgi:hypothetical protein
MMEGHKWLLNTQSVLIIIYSHLEPLIYVGFYSEGNMNFMLNLLSATFFVEVRGDRV